MKTFRLIVASRLAIFPLVFNFSIAQEAEVNTEGFEENEQISIDSSEPHPDPLQTPSKSSPDRDDLWDFQSLGEGKHGVVGEVFT